MPSALAVAGVILLLTGVVAGLAGIGMLYMGQADEEQNDDGIFRDTDRSEDNERRERTGRIVALSGGALLVAGGVMAAVGNGGKHPA